MTNHDAKQEQLLKEFLSRFNKEAEEEGGPYVFDKDEAAALRALAQNYIAGKMVVRWITSVGKAVIFAAAVYGAYSALKAAGGAWFVR